MIWFMLGMGVAIAVLGVLFAMAAWSVFTSVMGE